MDMEYNCKSCTLIDNHIMRSKNCKFEFKLVEKEKVANLLRTISVENWVGTDCLDSKLLRTAAIHISNTV